jgi:hypothetical protein
MGFRLPHARRALVVAAALGGCVEALGIEPLTEAPPPLALGGACDACVASTCHDAERACAADAHCVALVECMAAAGRDHPIARRDCELEHPEALGEATFEALHACLRAPCQDGCLGRKGFFDAFPEACRSCTATECLEFMSACVAEEGCERVAVDVLRDPTSLDTEETTRLSTALATHDAQSSLHYWVQELCSEECGFDGRDFECAGEYDWPSARNGQVVAFEVAVSRPAGGVTVPVSGARVDVCPSFDTPCVPIATSESDAQGLATGNVTLGSDGFRGYFRITEGESGVPLLPTHALVGWPGTRSFRGIAFVLSRDDLFFGPLDEERGHLAAGFLDCTGVLAVGVRALLPDAARDAKTRTSYLRGGDETAEDDYFIALDALPGCYEIAGDHEGTGSARVEGYRTGVTLSPGALTFLVLAPKTRTEDVVHTCPSG